MPIVQHEELRRFGFEVFKSAGLPDDDAKIVSDHLVNSNLCGHDSHGVWFVPNYAWEMRERYKSWEDHKVIKDTPCLRVIDGNGANGIVAVTKAVDIAVEKARQATFGFVGLSHITHIGRLGEFPPRIAEQGMIGMIWLNGGGLFMTPFGSADRKLRPEPMAFSAPRKNGAPFVLDLTMCVVAGGKIEQKRIRKEPMPEGWVVDHKGNWVTDTKVYHEDPEHTGVVPLGGMQFGHKGFGLAMMVEMLVGPLTGAGCTHTKDRGASRNGDGTMILAIDIASFTELKTYQEDVEGLAEWVCGARPLPGFDKVYAPGEIEQEKKAKLIQDGIDVPDGTWEEFEKAAEEFQVALPNHE
jgi:uncharacterized oxidoreductase